MKLKYFVLFVSSILCNYMQASAQLRLPKLIRDSMILQRDIPLNIWGWSLPEDKIKIQFNHQKYTATTGKDGKWIATIDAIKAGETYSMQISNNKQTIVLNNILAGDVWICSGQSNMVHQMTLHSVLYADEIAQANNPEIRHFWIPNVTDLNKPHEDLTTGFWKSANPQDILQFSAVAYFFAKKVYEKYHIPIGLINASVGGTPIEAWISEEGFKDFPSIQQLIKKNKDSAYINDLIRRSAAFNASRPPRQEDKGMVNKWYDANFVPKGWYSINVPGFWEDQGIKELDGIVWYRKEIEIPASMTNVSAKLFLGRIVDADNVYINGTAIGNTTYMYPQRRYTIAPGILRAGKNIITVRVQNNAGKGGFVPDKPYHLIANNQTIDLRGEWKYKVGSVFIPQREFGPSPVSAQNQPIALYNAMIAPLTNYACKGFLWYQGEANSGRANEYMQLQSALVKDWRNKWQNNDAPFLYVQLPGFMDMNYLPSESQWAAFREAQLKSLSIPNSAMAVAIDIGEWNDIHPDRKKEVGDRLFLAAEKIAYQQKEIVYSGPIFQTATVEGNKINISFNNIGTGLVSSDGEELNYFSIAGAEKKFVWAKAKIEGNHVIVWNDAITNPLFVRYAWADNPAGANLSNKEGLPASPFRTDQ